MTLHTLVPALIFALAVYAVIPLALRSLKPPLMTPASLYTDLNTWEFRVLVSTCVFAATLVCGTWGGVGRWLPVAVPAVFAACIDWRTHHLPKQLHYLAVVCFLPRAVEAYLAQDLDLVIRACAAGFFTTVLFWVLWRTGKLGYGDVRLAGLVAVCTAATSWYTWYSALCWAGIIGSCTGFLGRLLHGRRYFAYGPALVSGALLALPLTS